MRKSSIVHLFIVGMLMLIFGLFGKYSNTTQEQFLSPTPNIEKNVLGEESKKAVSPTPSITIDENAVLVTKVIDGDTIEIEGHRKVRYIGIDTPELHHPKKSVQCFGKEAQIMNSTLVEGKEVRLDKDVSNTDRYGRLLRYVYNGDLMINDYLVRQGYARAATFPPDVKYAAKFRQAEQEARENSRGLWKSCQ